MSSKPHPEQARREALSPIITRVTSAMTVEGDTVTLSRADLTELMVEVRTLGGIRDAFLMDVEHYETWADDKLTPLPISQAALLALPEYSASIPSGKTIGKRWRINTNFFRQRKVWGIPDRWVIGEYTRPTPGNPGQIDITWYLPVIEGQP